MNIKFKWIFLTSSSNMTVIKHINDLIIDENSIFYNFCEKILLNDLLPGKNKYSAKVQNLYSSSIEKHKYITFLNENFKHYHLGKLGATSPKFKYNSTPPNLNLKSITDVNETIGEYQACGAVLNYKIENNTLIIYNISLHGSWIDVVENLWKQGIDKDYCECLECDKIMKPNSRCDCIPNARKCETVCIGHEAYDTDFLDITVSNFFELKSLFLKYTKYNP